MAWGFLGGGWPQEEVLAPQVTEECAAVLNAMPT